MQSSLEVNIPFGDPSFIIVALLYFILYLSVTGSYLILGTRVVLRASSMFIKVQLTRRIVFFQLLYSFGLYTEVKRSTEKITLRNSLSIVTFTA